MVTNIHDPAFLTESFVRSQTWELDPRQRMGRDICEYGAEVPKSRADYVPAHFPGTNPFLHEVADEYGLPYEAVRGGAETTYPEYRKKMPKPEHPLEACQLYCACGQGGLNACLREPGKR